jgi:hypothetical protein
MTAEADPTDAANGPPSSPVKRAMRRLVAYASQSSRLSAYAAAVAPAMGRFDDMTGLSIPPAMGQAVTGVQQQDPSATPGVPLLACPVVPPPTLPDNPTVAPDSGTETGSIGNSATGPAARFESLDGLYQRIAASAAGGGSDEQANKANVETARNTSLILQALEAQNRLLENGKGQQQQQILWQ